MKGGGPRDIKGVNASTHANHQASPSKEGLTHAVPAPRNRDRVQTQRKDKAQIEMGKHTHTRTAGHARTVRVVPRPPITPRPVNMPVMMSEADRGWRGDSEMVSRPRSGPTTTREAPRRSYDLGGGFPTAGCRPVHADAHAYAECDSVGEGSLLPYLCPPRREAEGLRWASQWSPG